MGSITKLIRKDKLTTQDILNEREKTHGDYSKVSETAIKLEDILNYACTLNNAPAKKLALKMICLKLARIVCGDPNFADHWDDIAGYAMLGKGKAPFVTFGRGCDHPDTETWIAYKKEDDPKSGIHKVFWQCIECKYVIEINNEEH